ncbi:TPA: hypothetical protein ACUJSI_003757 [Klebsiella pneumoniae]
MTKSTITRERLEKIASGNAWVCVQDDEAAELARMALAAMDSEPVAYMTYKGYLLHAGDPKLAEYSEPMPLYADPRPEPISAEPVAWLLSGGGAKNVVVFDSGNAYADPLREVTPLYRHAQPAQELKPVGYLFVSEQGAIAYSPTNWGMPGFRLIGQIYGDIDVESQPAPVVPDDVLDALQKVARIRLDLNDFDGDRRDIADCLGDAEEALIEVVNRRAAMLAAAPQEVKP